MRLQRPTYTKPIPPGATIEARDDGSKWAAWTDERGRRRRAPLSGTGASIVQESGKWHVDFQDARGEWRDLPAFTDKSASEKLGRRCELLAETVAGGDRPDADLAKWIEGLRSEHRDKLAAWGLIDERVSAASKPLAKWETAKDRGGKETRRLVGGHLHDWRESLRAKGSTERHVALVTARALRVLDGFTFWSDVDAGMVERLLKSLRDGTEETPGIGAQTSNFHLAAAKQFARWMVEARRASESPLSHLKSLNVRVDRRRDRRALSAAEVGRLLAVTHGGPERCGIPAPERALLYRVALETGLRRGELESLTRAGFDVDSDEPTVAVEAAYSKHRRRDVLPLRLGLVEALRTHLAAKAPAAPAFKVPDRHHSAKMFREDLEAAGIPHRDDAGRVADFHALRHTFITNLTRSGAKPKVVQMLARHSTFALTMDRYTHLGIHDERAALESLPTLADPASEVVRATGTDGPACAVLELEPSPGGVGGRPVAVDTGPGRAENAFSGRTGGRAAEGTGLLNRRRGCSLYRGFESRPVRFTGTRERNCGKKSLFLQYNPACRDDSRPVHSARRGGKPVITGNGKDATHANHDQVRDEEAPHEIRGDRSHRRGDGADKEGSRLGVHFADGSHQA